MIASAIEYERMALTESKLWWYKILHEKALKGLFASQIKKEELIVDMGCGTGGLLKRLNQEGYINNKGIDCSEYALSYCIEKGLNVEKGNILDGKSGYLGLSPKVLLYNDSLCYFSDIELKEIVKNASEWIPKEGLIILNFPTLNAFRGIHDISVGIQKRQTKRTIEQLLQENGFVIVRSEYWPFLLSPIIFAIRSFQRLKLYFSKNIRIESDVTLPMPFLNNLFYFIAKLESTLPKPWGSSAFIIAKK